MKYLIQVTLSLSLFFSFENACLGQMLIEHISPMNEYRESHTLTGIYDFGLLVVGGFNGESTTATCERYDVDADTWSVVDPIPEPRQCHTSHGNAPHEIDFQDYFAEYHDYVIVIGGRDGDSIVYSSTLIFDIQSESWLDGPDMITPRYDHTSTMFDDGRILIAGGFNGESVTDKVSIFNPVDTTIIEVANMNVARMSHTATRLYDGRILVAGGSIGEEGSQLNSSEIYDPVTNEWTEIADLNIARDYHAAVFPLGVGCDYDECGVFVVGGRNFNNSLNEYEELSSVEYYCTCNETWTLIELDYSQCFHDVFLINYGKGMGGIFVTGGTDIYNEDNPNSLSPPLELTTYLALDYVLNDFIIIGSQLLQIDGEGFEPGRFKSAIGRLALTHYVTGGDVSGIGTGWKLDKSLSVNETPAPSGISIFPNPAIDKFVALGWGNESEWSVYDLMGKQIRMGKGSVIDVSHLDEGQYILSDVSGNSTSFVKLNK